MGPRTAYLGLGSNLGDRLACLGRCIEWLEGSRDLRVMAQSGVWRTAPLGPVQQPDFANQVVSVETELGPRAMLELGLELERRCGRRRDEIQGPRTLDVDLLLHGAAVVQESGLVVPHPRLAERLFVLMPLAEIAPELRHPVLGSTIAELRDALGGGQRVERWNP